MKLAALLFAIACAACPTAQGKADPPTHVKVPVELWVSGDDGLTQRLADAVRSELTSSGAFALSPAGMRNSLKLTIPHNAGWRQINGRTQVSYDVRLERGGRGFKGRRGHCWESELVVCAKQVVRTASLSLAGVR